MIKRDTYLQQIIRNMWNGEIKVITGIRRCGKSVLLFNLFKDYLLSQNIPEDNIIKIELDQRRYYKFRNPITLCEYVESIISKKNDEEASAEAEENAAEETSEKPTEESGDSE